MLWHLAMCNLFGCDVGQMVYQSGHLNEVAIVLCASEVRRQTSRDHATRFSASLEGAGFALDVRLPYRSMKVSFGFPIDGLKVVFVGDEGKQAYIKTLPL